MSLIPRNNPQQTTLKSKFSKFGANTQSNSSSLRMMYLYFKNQYSYCPDIQFSHKRNISLLISSGRISIGQTNIQQLLMLQVQVSVSLVSAIQSVNTAIQMRVCLIRENDVIEARKPFPGARKPLQPFVSKLHGHQASMYAQFEFVKGVNVHPYVGYDLGMFCTHLRYQTGYEWTGQTALSYKLHVFWFSRCLQQSESCLG